MKRIEFRGSLVGRDSKMLDMVRRIGDLGIDWKFRFVDRNLRNDDGQIRPFEICPDVLNKFFELRNVFRVVGVVEALNL